MINIHGASTAVGVVVNASRIEFEVFHYLKCHTHWTYSSYSIVELIFIIGSDIISSAWDKCANIRWIESTTGAIFGFIRVRIF